MDAFDRIAEQVSDLLPLLAVKLIRFVRDLPDPEITVAQAFLLHNLRRHGPCTASEIAEMMGITSGPVTNLTKRLMARGLVERRRDETDKRMMWFALTPAGQRVAEDLRRYSTERWAQVARHLGLQDAQSAVHLMQRTVAALEQLQVSGCCEYGPRSE